MTVVVTPEVVGETEFCRAITSRLADAVDEFEATGRTEHESFDAEIQLDGNSLWVPVTVYHLTDIVARGTDHHCGQPTPDTAHSYPLARITALRYRPITAARTARATPLDYTPPVYGFDTHTYDLRAHTSFTADPVRHYGFDELAALSASPHWEDRVRAELLREHSPITLPDQFPCLYETPDSPAQSGTQHQRPHPWVVSPDIDMLGSLLAEYQQMWDDYTAQWGPRSRRTFAVGRLDGLSPRQVYRPGATPTDVIGHTLITQGLGFYQRQCPRIQAMHPRHVRQANGTASPARHNGG